MHVKAGAGNWLLLSISFAIIITTQQRRHMAERYAKLEDESTPLEVHTLRRIWAFVVPKAHVTSTKSFPPKSFPPSLPSPATLRPPH